MIPIEILSNIVFGETKKDHCVQCKQQFSYKNVHTKEGWAETKISGLCEDCFDDITKEVDDEYTDDNEDVF